MACGMVGKPQRNERIAVKAPLFIHPWLYVVDLANSQSKSKEQYHFALVNNIGVIC